MPLSPLGALNADVGIFTPHAAVLPAPVRTFSRSCMERRIKMKKASKGADDVIQHPNLYTRQVLRKVARCLYYDGRIEDAKLVARAADSRRKEK